MMTANMEFMYWRTNKEWYTINREKDCFELTEQAPSDIQEAQVKARASKVAESGED